MAGIGGTGVAAHHASINFTKGLHLDDAGPRKIKSMRFSTMSSEEVTKTAEVQIFEHSLYQLPERKPLPYGVLDTRLGTSNKKGQCTTCDGKLADCPGHFGYIKLELPVFHIGYFKDIIVILQCICKGCARILLPEEERQKWQRRMQNPRSEILRKKEYLKKINDLCKKVRACPRCGDINGVVKKLGSTLKIIHDKYAKNYEAFEEMAHKFDDAVKVNKEMKGYMKNIQEDLTPLKVLGLFEKIIGEDCVVLDLVDRPEQLIVQHMPVPPVAIRPSVEMDAAVGSNEDDVTIKLMHIIEQNNQIRACLESGLSIAKCMEIWDFLQIQVAMYINSELPGLPPNMQTGKPLRGFVQRLKGKQGRFRGNLSGKRVDFTGRTVISPDPNLKVSEVAVPILMAQTLTYPEKVSAHNIEKLRQRVINGKEKHPGANFVVFPDGVKRFLKFGDRKRIASELKYGDVVERHLEDGDIVLFNRQPSLHRMSIMCHRARVMPWRTLRFNESVCNPYNADFDGDEMNMHVPQTEEARTEALTLMGVQNNLCTPKNGEILVASTQDFLTSSFLITRRDTFYDRGQFALMCSYMGDAVEHIDLPTPAILKPVELWTGKQLFGVLIRPSARIKVFLNFVVCEKNHKKGTETMCPKDGYVFFKNSELICGQLGKGTLGNGSKDGLFTVLLRDYGEQAAASCMNRLAKLSARWIGNHGFSIGIDDVQPGSRLTVEKEKRIAEGYRACDKHISLFNKGQLTLQPGCDAAQTLESEITGELNKIREAAGQVCVNELHWRNSPLIMSQCGSKGSVINISQMIACVGQQSVSGHRAPNGFIERSLPHFPRNDKTPQAKGFVANSFYSGLTATEFIFHTMGGREGLVDTAVKTAETGYMSRRLMKALEDLSCQYDGTVRNSSGVIVQLIYGDDSMDPVSMEGQNGTPLNLDRVLMKAKATCPRGATPALPPSELWKIVESKFSQDGSECSMAFLDSLRKFLRKEFDTISSTRKRLSLPLEDFGNLDDENVAANVSGLTSRQLEVFLNTCIGRYHRKKLDPGTAVGAIGAQSIGEPGTQMTLKTFHFAGVASMNITLGVPRIKEIINASKKISTPIITAKLVSENDVKAARIVKGRIEKTALGDVAKSIKIVLRPGQAFVSIKLDMDRIYSLQLDIRAETVAEAVLKFPKIKSMKLKEQHVKVNDDRSISLTTPESDRKKMLFALHSLQNMLPKVIVKGIPTVERAVINQEKGKYNLLVEGTNLKAVMGTEGVDGRETTSNHIFETVEVLGIEAARNGIIKEIQYTMGSHGMSIDQRHMMLLADVMTYRGRILGITRFGMAKMKDSVLMLASFEKTTDHLFAASVHGRTDQIEGVSECIIMGIPMPLGTGLFKVRQKVGRIPKLVYGPPPLFS
ncbi:DNA-directed RNA polymerase III subunit 1 [Selaginella moellendorffii]|uniref:DNA-directed RNA polymerase III subunit 1 n=1 Tax=Selaginella moellendorffii TaxID=88036 RepID=UPI000D1C8CB3|nr:DNA-directed RNA polymerase III subunit 1 [Selaginella moellendorffii]|eukprot:XP_024535104.1 DNA-directed RNA polymerase III subunit 1 [Selaginella moellendorffii]